MSQRTLIHGFGYGRSTGSLNLPGGRLACTETLSSNCTLCAAMKSEACE